MFFKADAAKLLGALKQAKEPQAYRAAAEKLAAFGARNPAALLEHLTSDNALIIGSAIRRSGETGLAQLRTIIAKRTPQTHAALRALWEFEDDAASEVTLLIALLEDSDEAIRGLAAHALGRIGLPAIAAASALLQLAQHGTEGQKRSALFALGRMGYDPMILEQVCYDLLTAESESLDVKAAAVDALERSGRDPTPCFPAIVQFISSSNRNVLISAALRLLERCDLTSPANRKHAMRCVESLILKDAPDRAQSQQILWRIDPGNALVFDRVEEDLRSDDWKMESACDVICEMKEQAERFVPLLCTKLQQHQNYWDFCWAAVDALNCIGPAAIASKSVLETMRTHPSGLVQARVERAIASIEGHPIPDEDQPNNDGSTTF